jgi:P-type Mg2+ transporter
MLSVQILLNNLLYAASEVPIPLDAVDDETTVAPAHWDLRFVRNFMLVLGPISSIFDFLTFALLLLLFHAGEALFQTGWFIESLATQTLVIFVLRTRRNPLRSRPHPALATTSLAVVAAAVALPFTPAAAWFHFVAPPPDFLLALAGMVVAYLLLAEAAKRWFFHRFPPSGTARMAVVRPPFPLVERR